MTRYTELDMGLDAGLDVDGITEELLKESAVYRADEADEDVVLVVNNTMDDDEDVDEDIDVDVVLDGDEGPDADADVCSGDGTEERWDGISSVQFFMAMEKVPTSTGQEKGYRVIPNGYSHVNGVKKPRFRVVTFDKPAAAQAREVLMASLNSELAKWADRNGMVLNYGKGRMGGVAGMMGGAGRKEENQEKDRTDGRTGDRAGEMVTGGGKGVNVGAAAGSRTGTGGGVTLKRERRIVNVPVFGRGVPLSLTVKWCFGSDKVKAGKIPDGTPRTTKPDTDNLDKILKDCMTRCGFWWDDAQVTEEHIGKYWSSTPGVWVRVVRIR